MKHVVIALLLAGLLVPGAGQAAETTPAKMTHSGMIVATGRGAKAVTLEELGPWTPRSRPIKLVIELTPDTKIELVARSAEAAPGNWPGGFRETPLAATELKPGAFATVKTAKRDGRLVAVEITVVSPTPARSVATPAQRSANAAPGK
jgi:hypothetical protein